MGVRLRPPSILGFSGPCLSDSSFDHFRYAVCPSENQPLSASDHCRERRT